MNDSERNIYDILSNLRIKIKTEQVDSMCSNKLYERTIVKLYFIDRYREEHFISDDFVDKRSKLWKRKNLINFQLEIK